MKHFKNLHRCLTSIIVLMIVSCMLLSGCGEDLDKSKEQATSAPTESVMPTEPEVTIEPKEEKTPSASPNETSEATEEPSPTSTDSGYETEIF